MVSGACTRGFGLGEHPEIVPPQYALGHAIEGAMLGTSAELEALQEDILHQSRE